MKDKRKQADKEYQECEESMATDIRCISLLNAYRQDLSEKGRTPSNWNVFGYYDFMDISPVPEIVLESSKGALEYIWEKSSWISNQLNGSYKEHVIYSIAYSNENTIKDFWAFSEKMPLLMVSIVHIYHNEQRITELYRYICRTIERYYQKDQRCIAYLSIDCSDIILFWSTASYVNVMNKIEDLCTECCEEIHDIFTIYAYSRKIDLELISGARKKLIEKWLTHEKELDIEIYLRGTSLSSVKEISKKINEEYIELKPSIYLLAGQEDLMIQIHSMPIEKLVALFAHNGILEMDAMIKQRIITRTNIGIRESIKEEVKINNDDIVEGRVKKRKDSIITYNYAHRIFEKLRQCGQNMIVRRQTWYSPLCELLNELCDTEVSSAAYDIYIQEIFCHKRLVEYIVYLLEKKQVENREVEETINEYLIGWSQLSFHAMHSEWQLTQTTDVNRLYIYPTKLCLVYSAILFATAYILADERARNSDKLCTFFLTPTLTTQPSFKTIYIDSFHHVRLVLGKIPPNSLYFPQYLIPTLIHEAAHYIGSSIRCRLDRLYMIWDTLVYLFMAMYIAEKLNLPRNMDSIHQAIVSTIAVFSARSYIEGENIKNEVPQFVSSTTLDFLDVNLEKLFNSEIGDISKAFLKEFLHVDEESKLDIDCFIDNCFSGNTFILDQVMYKGITRQEITQEFEVIFSLYRESFSDICMIKLLNLEAAEYLQHIVFMYGVQGFQDAFTTPIDYIRIYAVLEACYEKEVLVELQKRFKKKLSKKKPEYYGMICEIIQTISSISRFEKSNELDERYIDFVRVCLVNYLRECILKLQEHLTYESTSNLREVYGSFSNAEIMKNKNLIELYEKCEELVRGYTSQIHKYLEHNQYKYM